MLNFIQFAFCLCVRARCDKRFSFSYHFIQFMIMIIAVSLIPTTKRIHILSKRVLRIVFESLSVSLPSMRISFCKLYLRFFYHYLLATRSLIYILSYFNWNGRLVFVRMTCICIVSFDTKSFKGNEMKSGLMKFMWIRRSYKANSDLPSLPVVFIVFIGEFNRLQNYV